MSFFRRCTMFFNQRWSAKAKLWGSSFTQAEWSHSKSMWVQRRRSSSGISLGVRQNADQRLILHPETCVRKSLLFRRTLPFPVRAGYVLSTPASALQNFRPWSVLSSGDTGKHTGRLDFFCGCVQTAKWALGSQKPV